MGDVVTDDEPRAGRAVRLLTVASIVALALCVAGYALDLAGPGTAAGIAALLFGATAMSWLSEDGRRLRSREPLLDEVASQRD
jgi:hypothetical protein